MEKSVTMYKKIPFYTNKKQTKCVKGRRNKHTEIFFQDDGVEERPDGGTMVKCTGGTFFCFALNMR